MHYASQKVPAHLARLFLVTDKKELEKYVKSLRISKVDLVTHTCQKVGYHHFIEYCDSIPAHLKPSDTTVHAGTDS